MNGLLAMVLYALTATKSGASNYVVSASDVRAEHQFSLNDRYPVPMVSDVFRDNILLTLTYMDGRVSDPAKIDWTAIEKPQTYSFTLQPGKTFAFQDTILPQFTGSVAGTMNSHFMWDEGFKSDGWLTGDGVCHLASFMYWVAKDAGLTALAPTNHNFAVIPDVPEEYGVAIFSGNPEQNLYITDNLDKPVTFTFSYTGTDLDIKVTD